MDSTHATVGVSATSAMAAFTTLFTGLHGLTGEQAASIAWLIVSGGGALVALGFWFVAWRWPNLPPLPGEVIAVPPGTPATATAVVEPGSTTAVVAQQPNPQPVTATGAAAPAHAASFADLHQEQTP